MFQTVLSIFLRCYKIWSKSTAEWSLLPFICLSTRQVGVQTKKTLMIQKVVFMLIIPGILEDHLISSSISLKTVKLWLKE
jgi:hypothetical protein